MLTAPFCNLTAANKAVTHFKHNFINTFADIGFFFIDNKNRFKPTYFCG